MPAVELVVMLGATKHTTVVVSGAPDNTTLMLAVVSGAPDYTTSMLAVMPSVEDYNFNGGCYAEC